jgi:hypothetical protein
MTRIRSDMTFLLLYALSMGCRDGGDRTVGAPDQSTLLADAARLLSERHGGNFQLSAKDPSFRVFFGHSSTLPDYRFSGKVDYSGGQPALVEDGFPFVRVVAEVVDLTEPTLRTVDQRASVWAMLPDSNLTRSDDLASIGGLPVVELVARVPSEGDGKQQIRDVVEAMQRFPLGSLRVDLLGSCKARVTLEAAQLRWLRDRPEALDSLLPDC